VRIEQGEAVPRVEQLQGEVAEEGGLAGAGAADQVRVMAGVRDAEAEGLLRRPGGGAVAEGEEVGVHGGGASPGSRGGPSGPASIQAGTAGGALSGTGKRVGGGSVG